MPKKNSANDVPAHAHLKKTTTRAGITTIALEVELIERLRDICYWDRIKLKSLVTDMLEKGIAEYEKERGKKFKPRPKDENSLFS